MNVTIYFSLAIAAAFMALYIKQIKPDYALMLTLAAIVFLLSGLLPRIAVLVNDIKSLSFINGISTDYLNPVMKIIGISYLCEISADLCIDAGERALAGHVETVGKIAIAFIALPIVEDVFSMIIGLLE